MGSVEALGRGEGAVGLSVRRLHRLPLVALGIAALLGALGGGLARLGWSLPGVSAPLAAVHGPLMVSGFLGTVIGIERAIALGRPWGYAAPLATGLGAVALIAAPSGPFGPFLITLGSAVVTTIFLVLLTRQRALFTVVMALGATAWLVGQLLWLAGWPLHRIVFWWVGFLVLTIAGERLELARLIRLSPVSRAAFLLALFAFAAGVALTVIALDAGVRLTGAASLAIALWLLRYDVARRTVRQPGSTRFVALCLLTGYGWLGASGVLALLVVGGPVGPTYDATLHAVFVGFVFSMIFGHAPIILPAVLGRSVSYRPVLYAPLALLHLGLVVRVVADVGPWLPGRQWGGLLNAIAILGFFASVAHGVFDSKASAAPRGRAPSDR